MFERPWSRDSRGGAADAGTAAARAIAKPSRALLRRLTAAHSTLRRALRTHMSPLLVALLLAVLPTGAAQAIGPAKLVKREQHDPRLQELTFSTPALASETHVRILLPAGYKASGHRRF